MWSGKDLIVLPSNLFAARVNAHKREYVDLVDASVILALTENSAKLGFSAMMTAINKEFVGMGSAFVSMISKELLVIEGKMKLILKMLEWVIPRWVHWDVPMIALEKDFVLKEFAFVKKDITDSIAPSSKKIWRKSVGIIVQGEETAYLGNAIAIQDSMA